MCAPPAPPGPAVPLLLAAALLAASCRSGPPDDAAPLRLDNADRLPTSLRDTVRRRIGSCRPARLSPGDTLTLRIERPHPSQLALVDPGGRWIYLVHPFPFAPTLASPRTFAADSVFRLVAGETRARVIEEGREEPEPILDRAGDHRILVLSHLGTDADRPIFACTVRVVTPGRSPGPSP